MSVHDRAAALSVPKFTLTTIRYSNGCMQVTEDDGLTAREVEDRKRFKRECWPAPYHDVSFEVTC